MGGLTLLDMVPTGGDGGGVNVALATAGLSLDAESIEELTSQRAGLLDGYERIELGAGVLPLLAEVLARSPYARRETVASDLAELQEAFYRLRDELSVEIPDADIIDHLVELFDEAGGFVEVAASADPRDVVERSWRSCASGAGLDDALPPLIDERGVAYRRLRSQWDKGELCCGWDGEEWAGEGDSAW